MVPLQECVTHIMDTSVATIRQRFLPNTRPRRSFLRRSVQHRSPALNHLDEDLSQFSTASTISPKKKLKVLREYLDENLERDLFRRLRDCVPVTSPVLLCQ